MEISVARKLYLAYLPDIILYEFRLDRYFNSIPFSACKSEMTLTHKCVIVRPCKPLVRLKRAAKDIVRYLPDEICFFSEVVWGHEEVLVMNRIGEL